MQRKSEDKRIFKTANYVELSLTLLLLVAFLADVQVLILAAFSIASLFIVLSSNEKSVYYLAFFTSFAGIFVYQERHLFFVMAALFIIKFLLSNKLDKITFVYYLIIVCYALAFKDTNGELSFAKVIGLILLFVIPVIANYSDRINCAELVQHYIFGFTIATIIGFFVTDIPSMAKLFEYDLIWSDNSVELTRFFGLAFDSNFYALSNFIITAYLLFAFEKINLFRGVLILFFSIVGLQTVSKSYVIILGLLIVYYFIKNVFNVKKLILAVIILSIAMVLFNLISNVLNYDVLDVVLSRFVKGGSFFENTTGRADIWSDYLTLFSNANAKEILFGFGFNASAERAAHNTFIEFFFMYGLVGTGIWVAYFVHCWNLFRINATKINNRSPIIFICLMAGIFFLSAYTYEAFFMGIIIAFMTLVGGTKERESFRNV